MTAIITMHTSVGYVISVRRSKTTNRLDSLPMVKIWRVRSDRVSTTGQISDTQNFEPRCDTSS